MAGDTNVIRERITKIYSKNEPCRKFFEKYINKKTWNESDWEQVLRTCGQALLEPQLTEVVGVNLRPWLQELLGRAEAAARKTQQTSGGSDLHLALCVALSKLVSFSADAARFSLKYFQNAPAPYEREDESAEPASKKRKTQDVIGDREILQASLYLLFQVQPLADIWKSSHLLHYLTHDSEDVRWLACQCLAILCRMSEHQREDLLVKHVSPEVHTRLTVEKSMTPPPSMPNLWNDNQKSSGPECPMSRHTVVVSGVSLPVYERKSQESGCLVLVGSTERNLEGVARGVCEGRPVLVQGAVGSGKTTLIEHLASRTGRRKAPSLTKVQLGDQTDSKTLLGTYTCTPTPGEFIWRPGSLTQAVTKGYWLLLEDIDYAPMDVISILVPLLESRTLPLPGHGNIRAHPNFQLFATRRTLSGAKLTSGCAGMLEKLWTCVTLETLTRSELLQLVSTRWPKLTSVSEKLVAVYLMLSAGQHHDDSEETGQETVVNMTTVKTSGRLVSTRDLMKWCSRIASHVDDTENTLAHRAFQEALDCFCAAVPTVNTFYKFALHIGSYMNRTKAEVEYYSTKYKPEVQLMSNKLVIGKRAQLQKKQMSALSFQKRKNVTFSFTRPASCLLERIGVAIMNDEPVLVVGETGTGKTSTVQYLAHQTQHKLRVINMNQQSDSADLLGGFKPVQMKTIVSPIRQEFEEAFATTFSSAKNNKFLQHIMACFVSQRWSDLFSLMEHTQEKAVAKINGTKNDSGSKSMLIKWKKLRLQIDTMKDQVQNAQSALAFSFIEGTLIKAIQEGEWVLLDEINLASAETLECLSGLLESSKGSVTLLERGDNKPITRHPEFRLFACMNPATDVGKKELPAGLRNRFTEFFMEELQDKQDISIIINDYLSKLGLSALQVDGIRRFYKKVKEAGQSLLNDGTGHKPHYSLRTLCRALSVAATNPCGSVPRSLYEAFCLAFLTQLDRTSHPAVVAMVKKYVMNVSVDAGKKENTKVPLDPIPQPARGNHVQIEGYWVPQGALEPHSPENYILTETVRQNLRDLVRVVSVGKFPVLLQGDTSVGKTSLVMYLATLTGAPCVRINNHEHTDLQEYVGSYAPDQTGKLVFREGALVKAMRQGHWIILDELNLAPSDVLEALNRLLDHNRELFIPETQETVQAHPNFMLFATQNPPGLYGGRKVLSRAFRNRFVELHFTEIPSKQLEVILHHRCHIPLSYSKKMVAVLQELQNMRRGSNIFQGKQSFITLRDLFRWAERYRLAPSQEAKFYDWDQHLADEGYLVLAARVRFHDESEAIRKVLEKRLKRKIDINKLFLLTDDTSPVTRVCLEQMSTVKGFEHVVWTEDMRRLYVLVSKALSFKEPVLLVGETGCGKTTVCQLITAQNNQTLHTVNCHMHTEGADFLGGLRPVRSRDEDDDRLFEWVDGPLILSMQSGGMFLADEISLADDSVLERLNSVLEPERMLVLAEKGTDSSGDSSSPEIIHSHETFRLIGTMNPGGDYGKKELSPALRNRFTEIWCPKVEIDRVASDVITIIEHNVSKELHLNQNESASGIGKAMLEFLVHFTRTDLGRKCVISIRDLLSWVNFINKVASSPTHLDVGLSYIHGACLVLLDGLGSGLTGSGLEGWRQLKEASLNFLVQQVWKKTGDCPKITTLQESHVGELEVVNSSTMFGLGPFLINKGLGKSGENMFTFKAPRTCINLLRVLRGLQLTRPMLLEGSPGVGKTSLVVALAKASGHSIVRINLSEQTDVSDLFGADLPVEGGKGGMFSWHDGPLLQALRQGSWVVLDELNLASQSVLEGLNACFDHRGEIYVSELGKTFHVEHDNTKIFACQNPQHQGGARKGLPKSFLNRFTQVHVEPLSPADLEFILGMIYSDVPQDLVSKMVKFSGTLTSQILDQNLWGQRGGPWDLNLRDLFRWCEIMQKNQPCGSYNPGDFVGLIYSDRMRTPGDKQRVFDVYRSVMEDQYPCYQSVGRVQVTRDNVQVGQATINKNPYGNFSEVESSGDLYLLGHQLGVAESIINCINMNWMTLLVGDSSVGKTSVVKLLAQLTGHKLLTLTVNSDMDVTELLGGFQQVDYGRELGEVVSDTHTALLSAVREALLSGTRTRAEQILHAWDNIIALRHDKTQRTSSEEATHFQRQCDLLLTLLDLLAPHTLQPPPPTGIKKKKMKKQKMVNGVDSVNHKDEEPMDEVTVPIMNGEEKTVSGDETVVMSKVSELREQTIKLAESVVEAGGVSGGGTFQWVDSTLVKALREGSWLLVDGVNICSASVLDRLNAMLEPGGVLTLSERGVVGGTVPSITPHSNFRLFLAMNPLHGEISRAMRNRGLEVCMTGQWTRPEDLRSVLLQAGLSSPILHNILVQAHTAVIGCLPVYEQPGICEVKQVAALTRQLMETGHTPRSSLSKALHLVYVRSQSKPLVKNAVESAVEEVMQKSPSKDDIQWPQFEKQAISIRSLRLGSNMCRVAVCGWLVDTLNMAIINPDLPATWCEAALPLPRPLPTTEKSLLCCVMLVLASTPQQDWPLLQAALTHKVGRRLTPGASKLSRKVADAIKYILSDGQCNAAKLLVSSLGATQFYDPRYSLESLSSRGIQKEGLDMESLANKSSLWLWNKLTSWYKEQCRSDEPSIDSKKQDSMTLLDISQAVSQGLVSKKASQHPAVPLLTPLLTQISQLIVSLTNNTDITITDQEFCQLTTALRWCDCFYQLCQQVIPKAQFHLFLPQLILHWQWVYEEFLQKIPTSWSSFVPEQLTNLVSLMQGILEKEFGPLHKVASSVRSKISPAPFTTPESADAQFRLLDIIANLTPSLENENVNKFLASSLGKEVCGSLINVATEIGTCTAETFESVHGEISTLEETIKGECLWDEEDIRGDIKALKVSHDLRSTYTYALQIQLWPLKDYLGIMTLYNKPSTELTGTAVEAPGVYREVASALSGPAFRCSSVLGTHKYLALAHSTAAQHTHYFLTYSHHYQQQDKEKISDTLHPSSCLLSYILLAGQRNHGCSNDNSMEEIQTGLHVEKVSQLRITRSTLWKNWATLADPRASYEASFTRYVTMYVTSSMGALANTVGVVPEFNIGADDLDTAADLASKIAEVPSICLPSECKEKLKELASLSREVERCPNDDWSVKSSLAASLAIVAGVIQANIIGQLEPVDPAQRINLLLQYHNQELQDLESHLLLTDWLESLRGSITTPAPSQSHPHIACYKNRCNLITSSLSQLTQQVAHRPGESAYPKLKLDFTHFLSTVFVPGNIWTLLSNLVSDQTGKTKESFIMKVNVLITSCDNFVKRVIRQYPLYRDLIYPFLQAVTITCEAFRLVVSQSRLKNLSQSCEGSLTHCLELYSAFPAPRDPAQPLNLLCSQLDVGGLTRVLLPETKCPGQGKIVNNLVLHAALLDFLSLTLAQHHLDKPTVEMASQLLDEVASVWRQQEEEKALRVQEEESLYKYKAKTMAASKTEDEIQEEEFQESFPSYDNEFKDMKGMTLDDPVNSDRKEAVETDEVTVGYITDEQLYEISELHNLLFTSLASTSWHAPAVNKTTELPSQVVPAALLRLRVLQSVLRNAGTIAGSSLDRAVIGTLILGNSNACSLLTTPSTSSLITHPYDIYKDPNTNEVMKVRPLLCAVKDRVDELLVKWPGHPSLEMINTVITRVLTFPLTSPLMRFVVGLETVLEKAQEWERNAHSGVSLMEQLEAVTNQVLEWRQLELNGWRSCLDTVTHKVATQGRKWWTHLHDTFQAALTKVVPMAEVLKTLKQFLETSTLGDFQMRLQLLHAFHCNAAVLEQTKVSRELLAISWNLHQYYKQFLPLIITTLSKARQPIDKEVKGYVKIARWNDINFFAVRESVAKSHRTLHRHMRNWEKQLRQPVAPILCDANSELNQNHTGAWDKEQDDVKTSVSISKPPVPVLTKYSSIATEGSVLSRLSALTRRCHKFACQMLNKLPYAAYVDEVEGTTTNIITNYQELQAAATKAEGITASDVRIKKLRGVMNQRRDSLFRLFKVLASMGVIYTRGNSQWQDGDIDACLSLPPVELNVSHSGQPSLQAACQSWPDCVKYLNRCIGRLTLMLKSLYVPHDDLGPELIKRLRGVSCHLFILAREQRKALSRISDRSSELRLILEDLRAYEPQSIASSKMLTSFQKLHAFASSLSLTITETQAVLNAVPRTSTPLVILENSPGIQLEQVDELQRVLEESKSGVSYHTLKLASAVKHFQNGKHLATPAYIKLFQDSQSQLATESEKLKNAILPTLQPDGRVHPALSEVNKWLSEWDGASFDPSTVTDTESSAPSVAVGISHLEYCVTRLLLSVESIFKRHCDPQKQDEEESEEDQVKNLLSDALCQNLLTDEQDLNAKEIVGMLSKIVKASENQPDLLKELKAALPLFEQYQSVCESVLVSIVSSNRSIAKLTSIILAIFQQLATKGFCKPKELEDEPAGEGATSFEDSDGTGLGDGEGKKDVSDRFESEDQLESALKEGESEKPGEQDLKEDDQGIEMSEDFEGKQQDVDRQERDENDSGEEDDEDQDFDKQMGETDTGAEKLDEKLWGDDADEEQDGDEKRENQDEEDGPGDGEVTESKMVAKDENKNKKEKDKEQKEKEKLEEMEDTRQENKMAEDGEEYNDNFTDPYGGEAKTQEEEEEDMQLPDDMILDDGEANEEELDDENERDMMDIPEKGVFPEDEREDKNDQENKDKEEEEEEGGGVMEDKPPEKDGDEGEQNETTEDQEGKTGDKEDADEAEEESSEESKKDERMQGTEEKMDLGDKEDDDTEKAEASEDKNTKSEAEAAEMDTTEGSKDQTKEQPKTESGAQREEDEETAQEEQGQVGEQTEDQEGTGQSDSRTRQDAHKGDSSALVTEQSACDQNDMKKPRKPGETDEDRTLGDLNKNVQQGLMTKEKRKRPQADQHSQDQEESKELEELDKGSQFEHIDQAEDHMDAQLVDAGTQDQAREAPAPADTENPDDKGEEDEQMLDTPMEVDEEEDNAALDEKEATSQEGEKGEERERRAGQPDPQAEGETQIHTEGEAIMDCLVQRPPETYFHTLLLTDDENQAIAKFDDDVEKTRREIETATLQPEDGGELWSQQEARVAPVALHLCEQLRLILEPTQAARLRGDFRTGKRLNMRKVIPYIASQFRKDKIWLRRTQPSKRTYQILVAVDDSESMCEARAGSLAIESVALVTRALTLLEVGQLGVISFGNTTKILHPLDQPYSEAAGAQILANLKFDQKVTNFTRMMEDSVALLNGCQTNSSHGNPGTAQLLLILSDGQTQTRSEAVKAAVRAARASRIFIVFLVLDARDNKYSFYDVLVYEEGRMMPLVESFPFPFFLVVRDIDTLPDALATALRQWFELVTADAAH